MSDCVFCEIVSGSAEASVVYDDDQLIGVMDIQPVNPGHVLLMPKNHVPFMADLDENTGAHVFTIALRIQQAIRRSGVRCEGINLFVADGEAAFQDVFHFHLHVIPRFEGDPFKIEADWKKAPRQELERVAAGVRAAYEELWG